MDKRTFQAAVFELSIYFERKPPGDETIQLWAEEVRDIPNRHTPMLIAAVKNLEAWPRNLANFMRGKSAELSEKNGENQLYKIHDRRFRPHLYAKPDCPKCKGTGLYDFHMDWPIRKDENGKVITKHVVKPALCECSDKAEYGF